MSFKRDNDLVTRIETVLGDGKLDEAAAKDVAELLSRYKSSTYKEWDDRHRFYEEAVSDMVNDCGFRDDALAEKMANDHPTLQQSFMRLCVKFIRKMAAKTYFDGRNEAAVTLAKSLDETVSASCLPFV